MQVKPVTRRHTSETAGQLCLLWTNEMTDPWFHTQGKEKDENEDVSSTMGMVKRHNAREVLDFLILDRMNLRLVGTYHLQGRFSVRPWAVPIG